MYVGVSKPNSSRIFWHSVNGEIVCCGIWSFLTCSTNSCRHFTIWTWGLNCFPFPILFSTEQEECPRLGDMCEWSIDCFGLLASSSLSPTSWTEYRSIMASEVNALEPVALLEGKASSYRLKQGKSSHRSLHVGFAYNINKNISTTQNMKHHTWIHITKASNGKIIALRQII